jgi:plastocyanin
MHVATLHLAPIIGAEKSRVPFYIAGGVLVAWALIISMGLGMRRADFPGSERGEHLVIAVSIVLVLITAASAVLTAGTPAKASAPAGASGYHSQIATIGEPTPPSAAPPPAAPAAAGAPSTPATPPKATTGTPPPPSSPAAAATTSLKLIANPTGQLSYNTKQLNTTAGTVTIVMTNMAPLEHNVTVASGSTVLGATPTFVGGTKSLTLKLKAGTYTFYCSVPGHRQAGMEGTLTVS